MQPLVGPCPGSNIYIACSGGVDSMFALSYLSIKPWRNITLAFFDHGTQTSKDALEFLKGYVCPEFNVGLVSDTIKGTKPKNQSPEEYWRNARYDFLKSLDKDVVLGHHVDDVVENWIFSSLHGNPYTIPYRNGNLIRPFLLMKKQEMIDYCCRKGTFWVEDTSNQDTCYMRNHIRHRIVPEAFKVNPGLHKVMRKKIRKENGM